LLVVGLWLVVRSGRRVLARLAKAATVKARQLQLGGFDFHPLALAIERGVTRITVWAAAIALLYLWLTFVLLRFPYSHPWGQQLGTFLFNLFQKLGDGALGAVPGMFTVIVIFLLARVAARLVSGIFNEIENGDIAVDWL